jgi:hypothetical protein
MAKAEFPAGSSGTVAKATPKITQEPGEKWVFEIMEGQSPSSVDRQIVSIVDNKFSVNVSTSGWRGTITGEIDQLGNLGGTGTLKRVGLPSTLLNFSAKRLKGSFYVSTVGSSFWGPPPFFTISLTRK